MTRWPTKSLAEITTCLDSQRIPVKDDDRQRRLGSVPYYGANGQVGWIDEHIFDEPLLLVAEDGGHFDEPQRGVAYTIRGPSWVNNHAHVLRPNESKVLLDFLDYHLRHFDFLPYITGTTRAKLTQRDLMRVDVPVPPLAEQRRIVKLLDDVDELRKLRAQADGRTTALIPAVFHEMFGDPTRNTKNWTMSIVSKVLQVIYRYPSFYGTAYVENGVPVARIGNILPSNMLDSDLSNFVRVPHDFSAKFPKTLLKAGDLVMAVRGDTTGKIGLVPAALEGANISPNLIRLSPDETCATGEYLLWLLLLAPAFVTSRVTDTAKKSITAENIGAIEIPLPPIALQEQFAIRVTEIRAMHAEQATNRLRLESLFQSLLHRALNATL